MIRVILISSLMMIIHGMEGAVDVCLSYGNYACNQSPPVFEVRRPSFCDTNCPPLDDFDNGVRSGDSPPFYHNEQVSYTCNNGFTLVGSSSLTCDDGAWNDDQPVCLANCPPLDDFDNGVRSGDSLPFYHNEQVSYTCNNGFTLVGSLSLTCDDGAWNDDQPVCLENCVVSAVPDSDYSSGGSVTHGTTFNVTCDSGFSTGTTRATEFSCNDGVLSPVTLPTCYGVSILLTERVNPYQPSSFICYARGNPVPDASSVDLYRRNGNTYTTTGIPRRPSTVSGSERAVVFDVDSVYPQDFGGYQCRLYFENNTYYSKLITNATYVLPVLDSKVEVSSTSTTVGLQWNAWSDGDDIGDPPLVGYDVFVQNDGKCVAVQRVDQPTTSAIVINLTYDTDYIFCVAAVREGTGGTGPVSLSHSTMTRCGKPSASPTGLQAAAINPKELELTWEHLPTESAECRSGVTHYMIYYVSTGSTSLNSLMVPNDTNSYTLRGLDTYLEYTIQLTASNKDEEGDKSSETASKTLEEVAPAPINLTIPKITTSSFTVSWSTPLPSNINGNIQKYIIRFKRTDPAVDGNYEMEEVWTSAFDEEHTVMKLSGEIDYTVQVQTVNGAGSSNWSEPVHAGEDNGSNIPLELVIGGVIGLLVIITLLIFTALMYKRIKQSRLKAEPIASPPNNAPEPSVEYENPVFDDTNQDPHSYENLNTDDHAYQDLNRDTPNYQNLTDPHIYQALKKPNINVTCQDVTKSDPGEAYEEV